MFADEDASEPVVNRHSTESHTPTFQMGGGWSWGQLLPLIIREVIQIADFSLAKIHSRRNQQCAERTQEQTLKCLWTSSVTGTREEKERKTAGVRGMRPAADQPRATELWWWKLQSLITTAAETALPQSPHFAEDWWNQGRMSHTVLWHRNEWCWWRYGFPRSCLQFPKTLLDE